MNNSNRSKICKIAMILLYLDLKLKETTYWLRKMSDYSDEDFEMSGSGTAG